MKSTLILFLATVVLVVVLGPATLDALRNSSGAGAAAVNKGEPGKAAAALSGDTQRKKSQPKDDDD